MCTNGKESNGLIWKCKGMEWNGMEWNGMEWNGMEWNGMEWNRIPVVTVDVGQHEYSVAMHTNMCDNMAPRFPHSAGATSNSSPGADQRCRMSKLGARHEDLSATQRQRDFIMALASRAPWHAFSGTAGTPLLLRKNDVRRHHERGRRKSTLSAWLVCWSRFCFRVLRRISKQSGRKVESRTFLIPRTNEVVI